MTELEALEYANTGKADYAIGVEQVDPYVMQGGFLVTEWPTCRSVLTAPGRERLVALEQDKS